MASRDGGMQPLTFETASSEPGHVCFGSGFINEN
jgi:hypothetical protein